MSSLPRRVTGGRVDHRVAWAVVAGIVTLGCAESSSLETRPPPETGARGGSGAGAASAGGTAGSGVGGESGATVAGAGGGGAKGSGGVGTSGGAGGAGGGPGPCEGVSCNTPPQNGCENATQLRVSDAAGSCDLGNCNYGSSLVDCPNGCANGECSGDPCIGVSCNSAPPSVCRDASYLTVSEAPGSCAGGTCSYVTHDVFCDNGCTNGACEGDPCAGVTCDTPLANYCSTQDTLTVSESPGTCMNGQCSYQSHGEFCSFGCNNGVCTGDPCAGSNCTTPPATHCLDSNTARSFQSPGSCSAGVCAYTPDDLNCPFGCSAGTCVNCSLNTDCAATGQWCDGGTCRSCNSDTHCGSSCVACGAQHCSGAGTCVDCLTTADCAANETCNTGSNVCEAQSCVGPLYSADFEGSNGGWTASGDSWAWGTASSGPGSCRGGSGCWATNLSGNYGTCEEGFVATPAIDLSACTGGQTFVLTMDVWHDFEVVGVDYDGAFVEGWNGSSWTRITPQGGYDGKIEIYGCSGIYVAGKDGFTDDSSGWETKTFTLDNSYARADARFRIAFGSDGSGNYAGIYVDNVQLAVQ